MDEVLVLFIIVLCKAALSDRQSAQNELLRIKRQDVDLVECEKCGLSFDEPTKVPIIINGSNVSSTKKYPWMVALIQSGTDHIFCGGAIISRNFILTAAHCMVDVALETGRSGRSIGQRCRGRKCGRGLFMPGSNVTIGLLTPGRHTGVKPLSVAADVIVHPRYYREEDKTHDIALIRLQHPINCNTQVNPICLPPPNVLLEPGTLVKICGYGQTDQLVQWKELREAMIQVIEKRECMNMGFAEKDMDKVYCLRGYQGETPCFGDSGGSMFAKLYNRKFVTLGVASLHSSLMCDSKASIVYTSVPHHLPWIRKVMQESSEESGSETKESKKGKKRSEERGTKGQKGKKGRVRSEESGSEAKEERKNKERSEERGTKGQKGKKGRVRSEGNGTKRGEGKKSEERSDERGTKGQERMKSRMRSEECGTKRGEGKKSKERSEQSGPKREERKKGKERSEERGTQGEEGKKRKEKSEKHGTEGK